MVFIDLLTLTTGKPVCFETRSAVRWRVPCSSVGIAGSGSSCTAARSSLRGVAVADDRAVHLRQLAQALGGEVDVEREAARGHRLDRAVVAEHDEAAGAPAQDARETVAQHRPGCHLGDRGAQRGVDVGGLLGHGSPSGVGSRPRPVVHGSSSGAVTLSTPPGAMSFRNPGVARPGVTAGARQETTVRRRSMPSASSRWPTSVYDVPSGGGRGARPWCRAAQHAPEAEPARLGDPLGQERHLADVAGERDLADRDDVAGHRAVGRGRGQRDADREVARGVGELRAADGGDEHVAVADAQPAGSAR